MKDRISIKRAKELCRERNGRLPRCGYEMVAEEGKEIRTIFNLRDEEVTRNCGFITWLQNAGGRFRVYTAWEFPW